MCKFLFTAIFCTVFVLLIGSTLEANAQSVSGSIGAIKRGGLAKGAIVLSIPDGLHVNSNRPNSRYAIPTTVKLSGAGIKLSSVGYPRGRNRKFSFSEDALNVYEGRAVFGFTVNIPQNYKGTVIKIRAVVRYQACTDEFCFSPKTQEITLTARI